ncbi:MAG: PAS domain S-box protein [Pirellulales bacterium]|nr:PAS domain S-box protein [Pirellulales bacterium]
MTHDRPIRILYMEDDHALARLVRVCLAKVGYEVEVAEDGERGLVMHSQSDYDLLLVDQSMPGMNGLDVIRTLAAKGPLPPTIIVTGTGDEQIAVEAMKLGVSDYLIKDVAGGYRDVLPLAIDRALKQQRLAEEKQQAEETLRASEIRFRSHFDQALVGMAIVSEDHRWVEVNDTLCKLFGYKREELLGQPWDTVTDVDDRDSDSEEFKRMILGETDGYTAERRFVRKNGRSMYAFISARCFRHQDGTVDHVFVMISDITQRKQAEQALRRRTRQLDSRVRELNCLHAISEMLADPDVTVPKIARATLDLIPPVWCYSDITCARIVLDNEQFQTPNFEETPWKQSAPIVVQDHQAGVLEVCYLEERPARDEGPFTKEERRLINDIADHLGRLIERNRSAAQIRGLKQQIEFVLGATKTGLRIIDSDWAVRYTDPQTRETYGDPTGKTCFEYFEGTESPSSKSPEFEALASKKPVVSMSTLPKEDHRPIQITTIPFQEDSGQWMLAEVVVDLSERKRMEKELAQAQKMEAIGQLAAGIAHEINTPIQYIGDNMRFLQEAFSDIHHVMQQCDSLVNTARGAPAVAELARAMNAEKEEADMEYLVTEIPRAIDQSLEGVERVANIVRAMKEFSHPGGGQKQPIELNRAIENTLMVSRNEWKYVADLETDFDESLPLVPALLNGLNQVILNLIMNAAQAIGELIENGTTEKGTITVSTRRDGDWAEIRIQDTGPGVPDEIEDKVFDPFFTTKEVGKGTGQGLSIVHNIIVEDHGGTVSLDSELDQGAAFIVRLPLADTSPSDEPAPRPVVLTS